MNRFKGLLTQCPHHGLEKWNLCQIAYENLDMRTRTMVESMCGGGFLYKNANKAWNFVEDLSYKTYEWEIIREVPSIASKIFMDNEGRLANDFVGLEDTALHCDHQLEVFFFNLVNLIITFIPLILMIFPWTRN